MLVTTSPLRRLILEELIDTGNALDALLIGLFKGDITPSKADVFATYTSGGAEADFTGYVRGGAVAWSAVFSDAGGNAYCLGDLLLFPAAAPTPPAAFVPNVIFGYFAYIGTTLKFAERFTTPAGLDAPVSIPDQFGVCPVLPRFGYGQ